MRDDYKEIYLESKSHPLAITSQAYEQIVAIVQAHLICTYCYKRYTPDNPQAEFALLMLFTRYPDGCCLRNDSS